MKKLLNKFKLKGQFLLGLIGMAVILVAAVVYVAIVLNSSVDKMHSLENEYIKEMQIASDLKLATYDMMFDMTKFGLTGSDELYQSGMTKLEVIEAIIEEGLQLSEGKDNLSLMNEELKVLSKELDVYKGLLEETLNEFANQDNIKSQMDSIGLAYAKDAGALYESITTEVSGDIKGSGENIVAAETDEEVQVIVDEMSEDIDNISLVYRVANDASTVQVYTYRAQATDDYSGVSTIEALLESINDNLNTLASSLSNAGMEIGRAHV